MAVDEYTSLSGSTAGQVLLGVDPQRFVRIAAWQPQWASQPLTSIAAALEPPAPAPVVLNGDAVRIRFRGQNVVPALSTLVLDVYEEGAVAGGQTPLYFGTANGSHSSVQPLTGCPCVLADLTVSAPPPALGAATIGPVSVSGSIAVTGVDVRSGRGRWTPVAAGRGTGGRRRPRGLPLAQRVRRPVGAWPGDAGGRGARHCGTLAAWRAGGVARGSAALHREQLDLAVHIRTGPQPGDRVGRPARSAAGPHRPEPGQRPREPLPDNRAGWRCAGGTGGGSGRRDSRCTGNRGGGGPYLRGAGGRCHLRIRH